MAYPNHQQYANLADDAYKNRQVTKPDEKFLNIGGNDYKVLAISRDIKTGYQGTVYLDVKNNAVIVAHRGTEGIKTDWKDAAVDALMVTSRLNSQAEKAVELTKTAMEKINELHREDPSKPLPTLTHTGHSLGGTLAQISAHYFNHQGVTFNAYGAASLGRIPEGGNRMTNYVKASDPVAAASPHYGSVTVLATQDEIDRLSRAGYTDSRITNALQPSSSVNVAATSLGAHSIDNFTGSRSILSDPQARKLADSHRVMIEAYRDDVKETRIGLGIIGISPKNISDFFHGDRPAGEPAKKNLPPLTQAKPLTIDDMPPKAQELCRQCRERLVNHYEKNGMTASAAEFDRMAAAVGVEAYAQKMPEIQAFNIKNDTLMVGHRTPNRVLTRADVDFQTALNTPVEESINRSHQVEHDLARAAEQREMEIAQYHAQSRGMSLS